MGRLRAACNAISPRGSFLNSAALLINGAAALCLQIYIRMHTGRPVNNGRQMGGAVNITAGRQRRREMEDVCLYCI